MQYLVKNLMISVSNIILGGFIGMIMHIGYEWMNMGQFIGFVMFLGTIIVSFVYLFLIKKFALGKDMTILFPALGLLLGLWIGWICNVYTY